MRLCKIDAAHCQRYKRMLIIQSNSLAMTHSSCCKCLYRSFQQNLSKLTYLFHRTKSALGPCSTSSACCFCHLCFKEKRVFCFIPPDTDLHMLLPSVRENSCLMSGRHLCQMLFGCSCMPALAVDTTSNSHHSFQFILFPLSSTVFFWFFLTQHQSPFYLGAWNKSCDFASQQKIILAIPFAILMMRSEQVDTHEGVLIWRFLILRCAVPLKTNVFVDLACNIQICQNFVQLYAQFLLANDHQKMAGSLRCLHLKGTIFCVMAGISNERYL